ncbi:MAG: hypothetical protein ACRCX8_15880 [Sarcina sp.]
MSAANMLRFNLREVRDFGDKIFIVDNTNDSWVIEWATDTTIRLMHSSKYNLKAGGFHHQRDFIDITKENIHIVYNYIKVHSTKVYNARYKKSQKTRMDYLFDKIK